MGLVTAMGCAGSALVAAALAVEPDAWLATSAALLALGVAGEVAAQSARGPGSFASWIIDALHGLDRATLRARTKGVLMQVRDAVDLRLNAIVDPERSGGHDLAELARLCAQGGATLVQLRDKLSETRAMVATRARDQEGAGAASACRWSSTIASMWRSPPAPTACMSARTTWRWRMREDCWAATPSSACRSRPWRRPKPRRSI